MRLLVHGSIPPVTVRFMLLCVLGPIESDPMATLPTRNSKGTQHLILRRVFEDNLKIVGKFEEPERAQGESSRRSGPKLSLMTVSMMFIVVAGVGYYGFLVSVKSDSTISHRHAEHSANQPRADHSVALSQPSTEVQTKQTGHIMVDTGRSEPPATVASAETGAEGDPRYSSVGRLSNASATVKGSVGAGAERLELGPSQMQDRLEPEYGKTLPGQTPVKHANRDDVQRDLRPIHPPLLMAKNKKRWTDAGARQLVRDLNPFDQITADILGPITDAGDYQTLFDQSNLDVANVFGLDIKTIVIDAGHGGRDPGAIGPFGLQEKDVTLDIAVRLRDRLTRREGYRILMTRDDDTFLSLKERVEFSNEQHADLFLSIHINSLPVERVTMVETYYFGPHADSESLRLAERENRGSGYNLSDFDDVIARITNTVKQQQSRQVASSIQRSLFSNMRVRNKTIKNWGIKTAPFVVLLGVEAPSVLAEISAISNKRAEKRLGTDSYRDQIASFLEEGILRYLNGRGSQDHST